MVGIAFTPSRYLVNHMHRLTQPGRPGLGRRSEYLATIITMTIAGEQTASVLRVTEDPVADGTLTLWFKLGTGCQLTRPSSRCGTC